MAKAVRIVVHESDIKPEFTEADDTDIENLEIKEMALENTEPETPARKQLKRDADRESLSRLEAGARTEKDFNDVKRWWKRLDANRMRKERYWEQLMSSDMFDWDLDEGTPYYMEDKLTLIFLCVCEMHELVEHPDIYRLIPEATDKQKEVFFTRIVKGCSTAKVADCHSMTDRNVRKLIDTMLENLRNKLHAALKERQNAKIFLTKRERIFIESYVPTEKQEVGRPKKEPGKSSDNPPQEKRKRGRPRKTPNEPTTPPAEKKKRGRPRKVPIDTNTAKQ